MDCERGPPLKIRKQIIDECFDKANFRPNLAVELAKRVYSRKERGMSNCSGNHRHGKRKLSPNRMLAVKKACIPIAQFCHRKQCGKHLE